jgi:hypothetical protein
VKLIGVALVLTARGAVAAELSGPQLLRRSAAAYTALRSYTGTTTVRSEVKRAGRSIARTASASIRFHRPGTIRIEGTDVTGRPFRIVSDGRTTWSAPTSRANPARQRMPNLQAAVAGLTAVSLGAAATVPAALLNFRWGNPFPRGDGSRRGPDQRIDGHPCYQVVDADARIARRYWIDRRSFLLRQMTEEQNARQLAAITPGAGLDSRVVRYSFR